MMMAPTTITAAPTPAHSSQRRWSGGANGGPRLRQMRLGLDPHSQRLLGETELSGRARAARHGVGALEVRQRRLLLVLPAQLQTLANQVIGIDGGGRRVGQRAQGNER